MEENKKFRMYGLLLYYVVKMLGYTMRIKKIMSDKFNPEDVFILTFWHNKVVMVLLTISFIKKRIGLSSPSKDGELITVPLEKFGTEMIRGSSDKDSVKSLIKLIKKVNEGYRMGTPVDGPKGPIHEVKSGMVYLAQKTGKAIVPLGAAYDKKWVFKKSWDKFELPKPFTKAVVIYGEPYFVAKDANLEEECAKLKEKINELEKKAHEELYK